MKRLAFAIPAACAVFAAAASVAAAPRPDRVIAIQGTQRFSFLYTPQRSVPLVGSEQRIYKLEQLAVPQCANTADVRGQAFHSCRGSVPLPASAGVVLGVPDAFKSVQMYNPAQIRFMPTSFANCNVPHVFDLHNNFTSPLISICCIRPFKPGPLVRLPRERVTTRAATTTVSGDVRGCLDPRYSDAYNYRLDNCAHIGPRTSRSTMGATCASSGRSR